MKLAKLSLIATFCATALLVSLSPATAGEPNLMAVFEEEVLPAIVCVRQEALYEAPFFSKISNESRSFGMWEAGHGTGTIIRRVWTEGSGLNREDRWEYDVLTNFHVGKAKPNNWDGALVEEKYWIVDDKMDMMPGDDIRLRPMAFFPDADMAILRTEGAPQDLPVADIRWEMPESIRLGSTVFTGGFPLGITKTILTGSISTFDLLETKVLSYPKRVIAADLKIDPGQSGSPLVYIEVADEGYIVWGVGLLFASASGTDNIRLITPVDKFAQEFIFSGKSLPSKRPRFDKSISEEEVMELTRPLSGSTRAPQFLMKGGAHHYYVEHVEGGLFQLVCYVVDSDGRAVLKEFVRIYFRSEGGHVSISRIVGYDMAVGAPRAKLTDIPEWFNDVALVLLNYFQLQLEHSKLRFSSERDSQTASMLEYMSRVMNEDALYLRKEVAGVFYELLRAGIVSPDFIED